MSEPFLGQVKMIGFNFAPRGYAYCDGQILPINQNQSLYSLLGTTYGGDGRTSFALPDLRSRAPMHYGEGVNLGQEGGQETVTLTTAEIPSHNHGWKCSSVTADTRNPVEAYLAGDSQDPNYSSTHGVSMQALTNAGGGQSHNNLQPYTAIHYIIALQGLFPSRN